MFSLGLGRLGLCFSLFCDGTAVSYPTYPCSVTGTKPGRRNFVYSTQFMYKTGLAQPMDLAVNRINPALLR